MDEKARNVENEIKYKVETLLRKQLRLEDLRDKKSRDKLSAKKIYKEKNFPKKTFKSLEELVRNYKRNQKNFVDYKFRKNKLAQSVVENENVLFVIRITGNKNLSKPQKVILSKMGLLKVHEGAFFKNNALLQDRLRKVGNHLMFGVLDTEIARDLIFKRSFIKTSTGICAVTTNKLIEDVIGHNILSLDDIVFEFTMGGENFDQIKEHIISYKLNKPTNGYTDKSKPSTKGGSWGYNPTQFSELVSKMI